MEWVGLSPMIGWAPEGGEIELRLPLAPAEAKSPGRAHLHTNYCRAVHVHWNINVRYVRATFCSRIRMIIMNGNMIKEKNETYNQNLGWVSGR